MAEDSAIVTFGKVVLGGAVGFALLFVGTWLGRGSRGGTLLLSSASRRKDDKRLSFVMIEPKVVGGAMGFRFRDGEPLKIYALEELISRVKDGGRSDVELRARGDVIHGLWDEALTRIQRAGLTVRLAETSPVLAGFAWRDSTRGQYR